MNNQISSPGPHVIFINGPSTSHQQTTTYNSKQVSIPMSYLQSLRISGQTYNATFYKKYMLVIKIISLKIITENISKPVDK